MKNRIFVVLPVLYILYNLLVFTVYGWDKRCSARHKARISERRLIMLAFLGGGEGAFLGMQVFRHKTKHMKFQMLVPFFASAQILIWIFASIYFITG